MTKSQIHTILLDRHQLWRSHDPTSNQTFDFCGKKRCHTPFFKKGATFCRSHLFLSHLLKRHNFTARSSSWPPPGYPPSSYLMLPNLTNQFIKLSDGDLQCKWNSDIYIIDFSMTEKEFFVNIIVWNIVLIWDPANSISSLTNSLERPRTNSLPSWPSASSKVFIFLKYSQVLI